MSDSILPNSIIHNVHQIPKSIKDITKLKELKSLINSSYWRCALYLLVDWLSIFLLWFIAWYNFSLFLCGFVVLLTGTFQRALGNLLHDACHYSLLPNRNLNDIICNLFIAIPLNNYIHYYRTSHIKHHVYLGGKLDPDFIHKEKYKRIPTRYVLSENIFNLKMWINSICGNLKIMTFKEKLFFMLWWAIFLFFIFIISDAFGVIIFTCIWIGSKSTSFHVITMIRELSDHVGLSTKNTLSFTRNNPNNSILSFMVYPHNNSWHLAHHIAPHIPHYNLSKVHKYLLAAPEYSKCHHCDGFFFGSHSLMKCLNGTCVKCE